MSLDGIDFLLNVNDGEDVLHDPGNLSERCNSDDVKGRKHVDPKTAAAMIATGQARRCAHCMPLTDEVHL